GHFVRYVAAAKRLTRHFEYPDGAVGAFDDEIAAGKFDVVLGGFEYVGGDALAPRDQRIRRLADDDAREPHGSAGMGSAADGDDVGIALDQIHAIEGDAEPIRDELRKARAVSLSARQGSDRHVDTAFG